MPPLISIITPTRNVGKVLEKSILSVINQDFENFEYIIIDSVSTDNSSDIINKYKNYIDSYICERDHGIYDAMNKGTNIARGEWIYFLGADDILCPNILSKISKILKNKNTIYYGNVYWDNLNQVYNGPFDQFKLAKQNICHQSIFYPRSAFTKYTYSLMFPVFGDYELNLRLFSDPEFQFEYFPYIVAKFSLGGTSSALIDERFEAHKRELLKKYYPKSVIFYLFFDFLYWQINWKFSGLMKRIKQLME